MTDKVIVLDGIDYLICNDLTIDGVNYLYVLSLDGTKYSVLKREIVGDSDTVESVRDEATIKKVLETISETENN